MANKNIPQIRFKGFEEEWEEKLLGEIGTINSGCDYKHLNRGNIPVYGTGGYMTSVDKALSYTKDAIGIGRKGTIDNPYILKAPFWTVDTLFYVFPKDNINLNFLFNLYCKVDWRSKNEASGVPSLSKGIINNVCIKTASLSEQTRIASLFTAIDKQISCSEAKLDKLRTIKKTLLKKMFASQGEKTPQIRFKGFEEEWEEKLLGEIGTINSGCDYKHLNRGNIPVYGTGGYMTSVDKALSYTKDAIGIGRKGTIDNPYILKAPFWTVDTLFYVFPKDNINLNFLFNLYCKVDWRSKNEASGVPSLSKGIINNVCIKTASLSEQIRIASLFTAIDKQINCQEKKIEKLKAVKKTLLKKMFV